MNTSNKKESAKKPTTKREKWRHAFAIGKEYQEEVTEEDERLLDAFAQAITKKGMGPAAILWFISLKPLNFIGASIMQAGEVLFTDLKLDRLIKTSFMPEFEHGTFVRALEKRCCVDRLIALLEEYQDKALNEKRKAKEERRKKKAKKTEKS